MQEENKENIVEEITSNNEDQNVNNDIDLSKFDSADDDSVYKVDISSPVDETEEAKEEKKLPTVEEVMGIDKQEEQEQEQQEYEDDEYEDDDYEEDYGNVPEHIAKLVEFMEETGGSLEDFVSLNKDYSNMDDRQALEEYYSMTKNHLSREDMNFLIEQEFGINEDEDSDVEIRRKKIAYKEQVAEAKAYLDGLKSDYYNNIQLPGREAEMSEEVEQAVNFYNEYVEQEKQWTANNEKEVEHFLSKTDNLFNQDFKGFEYQIGDKRFRYNVKDVDTVRDTQADVNNYIRKFLNEDGLMEDAVGYHKGLYTAMNADAIAQHFYEQGKADAIKDSMSKSKNINMNSRQQHREVKAAGTRYKVLGNTSSDYKFKIKSRKK
tara:strand:- start:15842 stop:16972 length:1131 start_codon:yes stop_codon:yes gene_type:complete